MANIFQNVSDIARESVMIAKNEMVMANSVDRQHSQAFTNETGDTIGVRKRTRFAATSNADVTSDIQDIIQGKVNLTLDKRKVVAVELSSDQLTLNLHDFNAEVTEPAMIELVQQVENDLHDLYKQVWNFTGTPGTAPSSLNDINAMRELLDDSGAPVQGRKSFFNPTAMTSLSNGLKSVFPTDIARPAIERSSIGQYAFFDVVQSQSIAVHTVGNYGGTPFVNGAAQEVAYSAANTDFSQTLVTDGWTATTSTLNEGDVFQIANVYAVNPKTRQSTGKLQNFVVRAAATADGVGNKSITISPPIITPSGTTPAYATVDSAPADNAAITVVSGSAGAQYPQNLGCHKDAFTLAFANLALPMDNSKAARESMDNVSVRVVFDYNGTTDKNLIRFDVLYGVLAQNPAFAVRHTG